MNLYMFCYDVERNYLEIVNERHHDNIAYYDPPLDEFAPKYIYFYADLDTSNV